MVARNAAFNAQRRKETALFGKNGTASAHPTAGPGAAPSGGQARVGRRA
jgi:hypothetical protein